MCLFTLYNFYRGNMGRVMTQTHGRASQIPGQAFSFLLNPQKLGRVF